MSYVVLARKYRPQSFDQLAGQDHIIQVLASAVSSGRLAHAYLFCGPRGIGKTSCARILAKSLNCKKGPTVKPCNACPACTEITQGNSFDVLEIDGASNRGIDEIRTLRENVKFAPSNGKYKIYIVDEVHMLTTEAFNALLKTLEEPPPHVKFIFATTDPNKVPSTIISRCQRYDFKRVALKVIVETLEKICRQEKFKVSKDALYAIAKAAQGSLRDALSILDQLSAITDKDIKGNDVYAMLGLVETEDMFRLTEKLAAGDCAGALNALDDIIEKGKDLRQMGKDLLEHLRNLMIIKIGGKTLGRLVDYPVDIKEMYLAQSKDFSVAQILSAIDRVIESQETARVTELSRAPLEIAFAKIAYDGKRADAPAAADAGEPRAAPGATPWKHPVADDAHAASPAPSRKHHETKGPPAKAAGMRVFKNEKGVVNVSEADSGGAPVDELSPDSDPAPLVPAVVDLSSIKRAWDAVTSAVSVKKISIATYLQEGYPALLDGERLTIEFAAEHEFHKSVLEEAANVNMVEAVLEERFKTPLRVRYRLADGEEPKADPQQEAVVQKALETFKGKVVSKWHA